jgi:hypothetical protein
VDGLERIQFHYDRHGHPGPAALPGRTPSIHEPLPLDKTPHVRRIAHLPWLGGQRLYAMRGSRLTATPTG